MPPPLPSSVTLMCCQIVPRWGNRGQCRGWGIDGWRGENSLQENMWAIITHLGKKIEHGESWKEERTGRLTAETHRVEVKMTERQLGGGREWKVDSGEGARQHKNLKGEHESQGGVWPCTLQRTGPETMDQIDVYGFTRWRTSVCCRPVMIIMVQVSAPGVITPLIFPFSWQRKEKHISSVTYPPPLPPKKIVLSRAENTLTPAVSHRQIETDDLPIFGCVCSLTEAHTSGRPTLSCRGNQTTVPSRCIWEWSLAATVLSRQLWMDSAGGGGPAVPHNHSNYWPFVGRLVAKVILITAYWTDQKLNTGSKCTMKAWCYLPELCLMSVSKSQSEATTLYTVLFCLPR